MLLLPFPPPPSEFPPSHALSAGCMLSAAEGTQRRVTSRLMLPKSHTNRRNEQSGGKAPARSPREGDAPWLAASNPCHGLFLWWENPTLDGWRPPGSRDPCRLQWLPLNSCLPWAESELTASTELITCPQIPFNADKGTSQHTDSHILVSTHCISMGNLPMLLLLTSVTFL